MLKINKNLGVFSLKTLSEPLQNRVPRVRVLLPLPSENGLNTAFKPFFCNINMCGTKLTNRIDKPIQSRRASDLRFCCFDAIGKFNPSLLCIE